MSNNRVAQLIQQLDDAVMMGDDDLIEQIRSDLFREYGIERSGRVEMGLGGLIGKAIGNAVNAMIKQKRSPIGKTRAGQGKQSKFYDDFDDVVREVDDPMLDRQQQDIIEQMIEMGEMDPFANGGRVGLQEGGLPTVSSILGLQSLQAGQTPSATPDLDALGLQSLLPPRPDLRTMTQQAGNPMNVPNPYNYGYGASADFGRRNLDALQYTGDSAFPMLQDIFGKDAGTLTQQELDDRLAAQKSGLSKTYQGQIDAKVAAMAEANKAKASAEAALRAQRQQSSTAASAAAADAAAAAKAQADAIAKLKADLAALQAAPPKIKEIVRYIPNPQPVRRGGGEGRRGDGPSGRGPGRGCFVKGTMIEMADGSKKEITSIDVGEETRGGTVLALMKFLPESIYNYKGVKVSGSHWVIEDNQFIEVENSKRAVATDTVETVYCFKTSKNRIWVNGVEFGDFETGSDEDWAPHFEFVKQKLNEQLRETRK